MTGTVLFSVSQTVVFKVGILRSTKTNPQGESDGTEIFTKKLGNALRGVPFSENSVDWNVVSVKIVTH